MKEKFMREAIRESQKAFERDEVPIGCVIVKDGKIIARAHNPMCAGAIANARLCKLYFGAYEKKSGSAESRHSLLTESGLNWSVPHEGGLLEEECAAVLKNYFKIKREERKKN